MKTKNYHKTICERDGFTIVSDVFDRVALDNFREEADRVSEAEGAACVRNLASKSKLFDSLSKSVKLQSYVGEHLVPVRSILFNKTLDENWPVAWHQDLTIAVAAKQEVENYEPWSVKDGVCHVQPPESLLNKMITVRIHLDPTPESNGALKVIPQSHLLGKLPSGVISQYTRENFVNCACEAGDVLLMKPLILHSSSRSDTPKNRRIVHFEYAPVDSLHQDLLWYERN